MKFVVERTKRKAKFDLAGQDKNGYEGIIRIVEGHARLGEMESRIAVPDWSPERRGIVSKQQGIQRDPSVMRMNARKKKNIYICINIKVL